MISMRSPTALRIFSNGLRHVLELRARDVETPGLPRRDVERPDLHRGDAVLEQALGERVRPVHEARRGPRTAHRGCPGSSSRAARKSPDRTYLYPAQVL